jgi:hypothetical protein
MLSLKPKLERKPEAHMVEIARSFSFKLNLGNYQSADFFQSAKAECRDDEAEELSEKLHAFCKSQVLKAANEVKKEIKEGIFANGTN